MIKKEVAWDLSEMFLGTTDPSIQKAINNITLLAENLMREYQGKIEDLPARGLLECMKRYEEYFARFETITLFSSLSFAANMTLPDTQYLNDKISKVRANVDKMLAFFTIELGRLIIKTPEILKEPALENYRHYLEKVRREYPYQLSEVEEKLVIEKDKCGIDAWEELQEKWLNTRTYEVEVQGKKKTLSFGEAYGLTYHLDRQTRESAFKSIHGLLGKDGEIFSSALRNICNDWLAICERRKYASPIEASLIANEIDQETISNMLKTIENNVELYQRYLRLKARILKLPKLCSYDLFAPISDAPEMKFEYEKAKELIIKAYTRFDEGYAFAAKDMFARNHIDSTPRLGKYHGSYFFPWYEGKTAYLINNYDEALVDVCRLAHLLGHATHSYYYERSQTILNGGSLFIPHPVIVSETASIFGELLLADLLLSEAKSSHDKTAILCRVLDGATADIFWTTSRAIFEQSLYDTIKRGEYLDYKTICGLWVAARDKISGDAVEYPDVDEATWITVPQFYMPNFRFLNYPYAYGQLFVYALYQKYLEEGKEFVPKLKKALAAGCSISPVDICKIFDMDVTQVNFWKLGLKQCEHFVKILEKTVAQVSNTTN